MLFGHVSTVESAERALPPTTKSSQLWKRLFAGGYGPCLFVILLCAACLNFWQLGEFGYSNLYYASGVRSMFSNWHSFFFVSFDPVGFVSVDKPPLDFWIQVLSAKLLGFSPFSLLLPQALAGVLSVALLAHLIRRSFGSVAALCAALALTVMPISVVTNRNNDVDSMLVLVVLLAAWAVIIAAERGSLRLLLVSMGIVGLGFNIKMAEAYLVLPAYLLLYLLSTPLRWRTKLGHIALASVVLLVVSLSWSIAVDLTPTTQRPYVGSSGTNSALSLAFGYNGFNRLLGHSPAASAALTSGNEAGKPGLLRLFSVQLAGQIGWLLPLALIGIITLLWRKRPHWLHDKHCQGLILWGVWFLSAAAFFSFTGSFHVYYMVMFAPAICALMGIGVAMLWHAYTHREVRGLCFPFALVITMAIQLHFLIPHPFWNDHLIPVILLVIAVVTLGLFAVLLLARRHIVYLGAPLASVGLLALLLAPAVWTILPITQHRNSGFPIAGPYGGTTPPAPPHAQTAPPAPKQTQHKTPAPITVPITDPELIHYLAANQGNASYLYATNSSGNAAPVIVTTGYAVMTIGGYAGGDRIVTRDKLVSLVRQGVVRYFLLPGNAPSPATRAAHRAKALQGPNSGSASDITSWVPLLCIAVPSFAWHHPRPGVKDVARKIAGLTLYDCISMF